ncbi:MAG: hypothetical protein C0402_14150 [Thermodesulfovibrio sp.]|nr:hypothetical protein [Thermodesulfovibrio sp.]
MLATAPDGRSIAFSSNRGGAYNIWLKDLTSGTLSQLTNGGDVFTLKFSPDGNRLAYFIDSSLYVLDLVTRTTVLVDSQTDYYSVDWSPDGSAMVFISNRAGLGDIYTFNTKDQGVQQIAHIDMGNVFQPYWTPDGQIVFALWDGSMYSLGMVSVTGQGQPTIIKNNLWLNTFDRIKSGAILYKDSNTLNVLYLAGHFVFRDVALSGGDNQFAAIASDSPGSPGQLSDEISVMCDTSLLPDLEITADDIYLYPLISTAGEQLAMNIVVWNRGFTKAENAAVDIYLSDSKGNIDLLKTVIIANIAPGLAEVVSLPWDTTGNMGLNSIVAVIDPQGHITERTKDNNYAVKDFFVVAHEGISMTTRLSKNQLRASEDLHIDISIVNSGIAIAGTLEVTVEDDSGYLVSQVTSNIIQLSYGYQGYTNLTWNTGLTYAGAYRVHAVFKHDEDDFAENVLPFAVLPDITIDSSLFTDKIRYASRETVLFAGKIENRGINYITPVMKLRISVIDAFNNEVFSETIYTSSMLPGSFFDFSTKASFSPSSPGFYTAFLDVFFNETKVSGNSAVFMVQPVAVISGSIKAEFQPLTEGSQVLADYAVTSSGNGEVSGVGLRVLLLDPEAGTVLNFFEELIDLGVINTVTGRTAFSTRGYRPGTYKLVLQTKQQGIENTIASVTFVLSDSAAPVVSIHSPVSGKYYRTPFDLSVRATDDLTGIDSVQYQVDRSVWKTLPVADISTGRYAAAWLPMIADEGRHLINFRATDRAGNISGPVSATITIDLTPPLLILSTLSAGSWTNEEILNLAGSVTDNSGIQSITVNDISIMPNMDGTFSYPVVLQQGPNIISVIATDFAGNEVIAMRTINLDRMLPLITINSPSDNMQTQTATLDLRGSLDEPASVLVAVNGDITIPAPLDGNSFSLLVQLVYGINTIEATATDSAGNVSTVKRTVTFDDSSPFLAVTNPSEDIKTNQSSMTMEGRVSDLTPVAVEISEDSTILTPAVNDGRFEQVITFSTEKIYHLQVKATDAAGNETVVLRNVIYDKTPPLLSIDPVMSPSTRSSEELTGTRDPGAGVIVTCATATVGVVAYPTSSTWTISLTDLQEGENTIIVIATDDAGNASLPERVLIQVDTTPPGVPVIVSPADGTVVLRDTLDIFGKAEAGAAVQMIFGAVFNATADALTGEFLFSGVKLLSGQNVFAFRAIDAAGNTSGQTVYSLSHSGKEMLLTGSIMATPEAVYQGDAVTFSYSLTNADSSDLGGLTVRAVVSDTSIKEVLHIVETTVSVPASTTVTGVFGLATDELSPAGYTVELQIASRQPGSPRTLASSLFEVMPGIEITRTFPDVRNVLVWVNDGCRRSGALPGRSEQSFSTDKSYKEHSRCMSMDLFGRILSRATDSYKAVYGRADFESELRNPFYTDVIILGNRYPLKHQYWEELREKVNSGTGLIAMLWTKQGGIPDEAGSQPMGITYRGTRSETDFVIRMLSGPVGEEGSIPLEGAAALVEAGEGATVAGWIEETDHRGCHASHDKSGDEERGDCDDHRDQQGLSLPSPAIVLNQYGRGRTIFYAFDLGIVLRNNADDRVYDMLSGLVINSLAYIHTPAVRKHLRPGFPMPIDLSFLSHGGAFDLKISQMYSPELKLFDSAASAWVSTNPWIRSLHIGPREAKTIRYYALMPDQGGSFAIKADTDILYRGQYTPYRSASTDFIVEQDLRTSAAAILDLLSGMDPAKHPEVSMSAKFVGDVRYRTVLTQKDMAQNISDILTAIDWLLQSNLDIAAARLMLDELLQGWESRYYWGD